MAKANYTTQHGYTYRIGSVLQLSMVNPTNRVTALAYEQALRGKPITHKLIGRGYMQAELGLSLAHVRLSQVAIELDRMDAIPTAVAHPGNGVGWPADWNLAALGVDADAFLSDDPVKGAITPLKEVAMPPNVALLTAEDAAKALEDGKAERIATQPTSLALATVTDLGSEPAVTSDTVAFEAAKALLDEDTVAAHQETCTILDDHSQDAPLDMGGDVEPSLD